MRSTFRGTLGHRLRTIGPGAMVAAAFTGPGTVTTASVTGAQYEYGLLWAVVVATVGTIIVQEMAARVGLVTGDGLGEAMARQVDHPVGRWALAALVIGAVGIGAAAFESGNLIGGAAGLTTVAGGAVGRWGLAMGLVAGGLLWLGRYRVIERALVGLVAVMAVAFVGSAVLAGPALGSVLRGFVPTGIPAGGTYLVTGIMGSQIVGYNLFLHASATTERWQGPDDLRAARTDTVLSISVGGLVMVAIMVTAAAAFPGPTELSSVGAMPVQIEPLAGFSAQALFAVGLFAAGFTSAMTAPLGAAYAVAGILGWEPDLSSSRVRAVWLTVLAVGTLVTVVGVEAVAAIVFAQVMNGLLLPVLGVFLFATLNDRRLMGGYANSLVQNVLGGLVVVFVGWLGVSTLLEIVGMV